MDQNIKNKILNFLFDYLLNNYNVKIITDYDIIGTMQNPYDKQFAITLNTYYDDVITKNDINFNDWQISIYGFPSEWKKL